MNLMQAPTRHIIDVSARAAVGVKPLAADSVCLIQQVTIVTEQLTHFSTYVSWLHLSSVTDGSQAYLVILCMS